MKKLLSILFVAAMFAPLNAYAADDAEKPATKSVLDEAEEMSRDFSAADRRHFMMIISNHNMIERIETVHDDVENTIKECGKVNPDMKADLDARYKSWDEALSPAFEDAKAHTDGMVLAQDYLKAADIRKILKKMDAERKAHDKGIQKVPVTNKEACEHLQSTLEKTEKTFAEMLRSTLISVPQVAQAEADKKKAEEEAAAKDAEDKAKAEKAEEEKAEEEKAEDASDSESQN